MHNNPPPVPILSQINTVHSLHPSSWRSSLILSSHLQLGLPSGLFPSGFPTKSLYVLLLSPIRTTCPAHLILLYLITRMTFGEQYISLSYSIWSFSIPRYLDPPRPKYSPQYPILKHLQPTFLQFSVVFLLLVCVSQNTSARRRGQSVEIGQEVDERY